MEIGQPLHGSGGQLVAYRELEALLHVPGELLISMPVELVLEDQCLAPVVAIDFHDP